MFRKKSKKLGSKIVSEVIKFFSFEVKNHFPHSKLKPATSLAHRPRRRK
ncbi:MAG: hypothetical protein H0V66_12805 [Bdellovibrionales bacterium]|nr:hypothetical protein [Bdellovibrionales bacterium]